MTDPRIYQHVQVAMRVKAGNFERDLVEQIGAAGRNIGAGGLNNIGIRIRVGAVFTANLDGRAKYAFEEIARALNLYRPQLTDILISDLTALHLTETRRECSYLQKVLERLFNKPSAATNGTPTLGQLFTSLNDRCDQLRDQYNFEIGVFVRSMRQKELDPQSSHGVTINAGHIGAVQTGQNASATVTMHIGDADRTTLLTAIDQLGVALHVAQQIRREELQDLLAIVEQARIATQEPSPKPALLRSLLIGLAYATQTIAATGPAWELIRNAVRPMGIELPAIPQ